MSGDRIALWWVDRYTRGLRPDTREARRAEIASDLWEHRHHAGDTWSTHLAILSRCLRGAPADLSWRRSRARRRRALPARGPLLRGAGWAAAGMAYAFLVVLHAWFASALLGLDLYGADWAPGDVERWSRSSGVLVTALLGGVLLLRATPRLGAALVAGASLVTAGLMWWALPVIGPIALAAATGAVVIARRRRRTVGGGRDARVAIP